MEWISAHNCVMGKHSIEIVGEKRPEIQASLFLIYLYAELNCDIHCNHDLRNLGMG